MDLSVINPLDPQSRSALIVAVSYFEAPEVNAVDTTGAGDAFIGAFAFGLSSSKSVDESIKLAVERASLSVTKKGTQSSYIN